MSSNRTWRNCTVETKNLGKLVTLSLEIILNFYHITNFDQIIYSWLEGKASSGRSGDGWPIT